MTSISLVCRKIFFIAPQCLIQEIQVILQGQPQRDETIRQENKYFIREYIRYIMPLIPKYYIVYFLKNKENNIVL